MDRPRKPPEHQAGSSGAGRGRGGPVLYPHMMVGTPSTGTKKKTRTEDILTAEEEDAKRDMMKRPQQPKENIVIEGKVTITSKIEGEKEALCCKYNEEYDSIAIGYSDGVINMVQSATGEPIVKLGDPDVMDNRAPVTCIKHRPVSKQYPITNCYTATYANGCVKCWSYNFNQCLYTIREDRQTYGLTYHPRFTKFVTFGDDLKVNFYDEETKTQERVLCASDNPDAHDGHMSRVFAACFHPKNNYELLTGGWDNVVQFWDLRQPHALRHISNVHMCGEGLDMNNKGTEVLACSWQKEDPIQVFDYASAKKLYSLEPDIYMTKLYCGKYATKDFLVCGGSEPHMLRVVDLQTTATAAMINQLPGAVYGMDMGPMKVKKETKTEKYTSKNDITVVPKIAFVAGKRLYQIDFV
ncbi:unnamed protein product [Ceutorhynchus assimilis]|uniref:Uncharacterized protein n=1 Tax=Ceutorhynchus assimilis TaxID=467358 RepID=A0A9N9MHC4_9CUCU|nr:unnamed protein product [Ceutorhynchus assimilis]